MDGKDTGGWFESLFFFHQPNERLPVLFSHSALWDHLCVHDHATLLAKVYHLLLALLHRPSVVTARTILACLACSNKTTFSETCIASRVTSLKF